VETPKTEPVAALSTLRRKKRMEQLTLWLVQAFIVVFRAGAHISELFVPPKHRLRLQRLREKMQSIEQDKQQLFKQIRAGNIRGGLEAADAMQLRYARPEQRKELEEKIAKSREMWQEIDALKAIASQAGDNKRAAVEGYQEYVKQHPDSSRGYSFLGGFCKQVGDTTGSLRAYQEALRLVDENSLHGSMAHLHVGEVYLDTGETEPALREFQHIIDHASSETRTTVCMAYLRLGDTHLKNADKSKAKEAWKMTIQWDDTKIIAKQAHEKLKAL